MLSSLRRNQCKFTQFPHMAGKICGTNVCHTRATVTTLLEVLYEWMPEKKACQYTYINMGRTLIIIANQSNTTFFLLRFWQMFSVLTSTGYRSVHLNVCSSREIFQGSTLHQISKRYSLIFRVELMYYSCLTIIIIMHCFSCRRVYGSGGHVLRKD